VEGIGVRVIRPRSPTTQPGWFATGLFCFPGAGAPTAQAGSFTTGTGFQRIARCVDLGALSQGLQVRKLQQACGAAVTRPRCMPAAC
jgi:hypothetical protein